MTQTLTQALEQVENGLEIIRQHLRETQAADKPRWMQSCAHETAHLVNGQGRAVCDPERITGIIGKHWHPWDYVKKCNRCMGWESKHEGQSATI